MTNAWSLERSPSSLVNMSLHQNGYIISHPSYSLDQTGVYYDASGVRFGIGLQSIPLTGIVEIFAINVWLGDLDMCNEDKSQDHLSLLHSGQEISCANANIGPLTWHVYPTSTGVVGIYLHTNGDKISYPGFILKFTGMLLNSMNSLFHFGISTKKYIKGNIANLHIFSKRLRPYAVKWGYNGTRIGRCLQLLVRRWLQTNYGDHHTVH